MQTGLAVFRSEKGQDHYIIGVSAGHGHTDAHLPVDPVGNGNRQCQYQKGTVRLFYRQRQNTGGPVSYTHLDVYKRQIKHNRLRN